MVSFARGEFSEVSGQTLEPQPADGRQLQVASRFHEGIPDVCAQGAATDQPVRGQVSHVGTYDQLVRLSDTGLRHVPLGEAGLVEIEATQPAQQVSRGGPQQTKFEAAVGDIGDRQRFRHTLCRGP